MLDMSGNLSLSLTSRFGRVTPRRACAQNGASGAVLAKMILNVLIDTLIGSIPLIGDAFDFGFKSNTKNIRLMKEHYLQGRHQGSAWKVVLPVMFIFIILFAGVI